MTENKYPKTIQVDATIDKDDLLKWTGDYCNKFGRLTECPEDLSLMRSPNEH